MGHAYTHTTERLLSGINMCSWLRAETKHTSKKIVIKSVDMPSNRVKYRAVVGFHSILFAFKTTAEQNVNDFVCVHWSQIEPLALCKVNLQ